MSSSLLHPPEIMSSTLQHFCHPKHPLVLKENAVLGMDAKCSVCDKTVIGSPTYTCSSNDTDCENFYLHKICAEFPQQINHDSHNQHPLVLQPPVFGFPCDVCNGDVKYAYECEDCQFLLCVLCAFEPRMLCHEGHPEHTLKLMHRRALITCDACYEEAEDCSYVCTTCEFWIHKRCALTPLIIPTPTYHHHPLYLTYSIPNMHRYFKRFCNLCDMLVELNSWFYYCNKCTFFMHIKCATSSNTVSDNEPDLVEFPLPEEESLFDLILTHCGKLQVHLQGEADNTTRMSTLTTDPQIIEEHWSHKNHPLIRLQFSIIENANIDNNDDKRVLICDGCIQPITKSHPSYYACIQCGFFLHSFCATKMPLELSAGVSSFHPQHSLLLRNIDRFYNYVRCGVCWYNTSGFYYHCKTCNIKIDIRCAFLPAKIKHKYHKHHTLVQRPFFNTWCSLSFCPINGGVEYACETCSNFQIHILCLFYPTTIKHRFDPHPICLRFPPFFYEGVIYCEICEGQVNNQWWLYHCGECDHSFHSHCIRWYEGVKLGRTIRVTTGNQQHTTVYVIKRKLQNSAWYRCYNCRFGDDFNYYLECFGCRILFCMQCVQENVTVAGELFFNRSLLPVAW